MFWRSKVCITSIGFINVNFHALVKISLATFSTYADMFFLYP